MVSLTAMSKDFPPSASLRVTQMLVETAQGCAAQEQPCVFTVVDTLKNSQDEIVGWIKRPHSVLYDPQKSLMPEDSANGDGGSEENEEDHFYAEGSGPKKQLIQTDANIDR